ncbi:kinase-like domain-containing protein [Mucor lusitanicus]|nr:kinase-like domain-containing protein [Mucor lusitanicus]
MTSQQHQQQDIWNQVSESMIDKLIDNKYQLVEELGRGSYGCLFLGQSLETNEYVAVKILCKKGLDPSQLALQQLEIDIQQSLHHAHLLGLDQVIQEPDFVYMVMELCDQGDLFEYVVQNPYDVNCHVIFLQILEAIEYMHQNNLYHRDIKLENILLQKQDDIKVADFGLATKERYSFDFGCGSTTYLGPEHFLSEDESDMEDTPYDAAASDIWSLGILLLALLFGRNPWQEATDLDAAFTEYKEDPMSLRRLFPDLSLECMQFLHRVLAIDPAKRVSISEMKTMFCELTDLLTIDPQESDYETESEEDEIMTSPVDIHTVQHKTNKASYDSAIFSQEDGGGSWSDMVEQDLLCGIEDDFEHITFDSTEDDEQELFIHDQEKESWWL